MAIIDKPTDYFNTVLYSGNASNPRTLSGLDFQPDWVWLKNRTDGNGHTLADAVRGANKTLSSDGTDAEITDKSDGHLDAFTSDGFTVGAGSSSDGRVNDGSHTYVAWNWKAGTSFTNDASATGIGSFDSTGSVNTDAGFSVISYTGNGSGGATVAHGLGSVPHMYIVKRRDAGSSNWHVYHQGIGATKGLRLNLTNAENTTDIWQDTAPTSSVFSLGSSVDVNASGGTFIGYIFSEKQGYSKFSSYIGNGNVDGTFIYTGFKPAFVMVKRTDSTSDWLICDNKRNNYSLSYTQNNFNVVNGKIFSNSSQAEEFYNSFDFVSNGLKIRSSGTGHNASGGTYIYMAFAENPFVSSTANGSIPATAR